MESPPSASSRCEYCGHNRGAQTCDEELLTWIGPGFTDLAPSDPARVRRIDQELIEGFDRLAQVTRAVSVFGSARMTPSDRYVAAARAVTERPASMGFAVITAGGPGIMEAANHGSHDRGGLSVGLNIELPLEQAPNAFLDPSLRFGTSSSANSCSSVTHRRSWSPPGASGLSMRCSKRSS